MGDDVGRKAVDAEWFGPTFGPAGADANKVETATDAVMDESTTSASMVENAIARALEAATAAGRFDVVVQLARELEARRLAREPNILPLPIRQRR